MVGERRPGGVAEAVARELSLELRLGERQAGRVDRQAQAALFFGLFFFGYGLRRASQGDDNGEKKENKRESLINHKLLTGQVVGFLSRSAERRRNGTGMERLRWWWCCLWILQWKQILFARLALVRL